MQKSKRIILKCLKKEGASDRFKLRKLFSHSTPTNTAELTRNLVVLEDAGCVHNNHGSYTITKKGDELLGLLEGVNKILS